MDILDYWLRHPSDLGRVEIYKLDPGKGPLAANPSDAPQELSIDAMPLDRAYLTPLIRVDFVAAQRGLGTDEADGRPGSDPHKVGLFSNQMLQFARRHLNSTGPGLGDHPDLIAAVAKAQGELDDKIRIALDPTIEDVKILGYPGLHDPQDIHFRTRIQTADLLNHSTAVQYRLAGHARRMDLDKAAVAPGKVAREVLQLAGDDAVPLHVAIESMVLAADRKMRVLSLFSALLFSPVYSDVARAAAVAADLAAKGVESPVFIFSELTDFCLNADINYDGPIASTWLVGVRTRPVDCLLDPALVDREKGLLDAEIEATRENINQKMGRFHALDPESDEAITARKAREAIEKGFPSQDAAFRDEYSDLNDNLPRLIARASEEALDSIRAIIDYRKILDGTSEDVLSKDFAKAEESAKLAIEYCKQCNENVDKLANARENLHTAFQVASVNAEHIPKLERISAFIDNDGPAFMRSASAKEMELANSKTHADARKIFRFELADAFVKSGDRRPLEIEQRLNEIAPEMKAIFEERIPELEQQLIVINERLPQLEALVLEIDTFITELMKKFRAMMGTDFNALIVPTEQLLLHPLTEAAIEVRRAGSLQDITNALPLLREPLYDIEASSLKNDVDSAKKAWDVARSQFSGEIDRVKGDSNRKRSTPPSKNFSHMRVSLNFF